MAAVPADSHSLSNFPPRDSRTYSVYNARDFMAGNAWVLNARAGAFLGVFIAMADAAGLDLDPNRSGRRLGNLALYELKRPFRSWYLYSPHVRHGSLGKSELLQEIYWHIAASPDGDTLWQASGSVKRVLPEVQATCCSNVKMSP